MLEKIWDVLSGGEQQRGGADNIVVPIDTSRIAKELDLDRSGSDNGRQNLPPSDASVLDAVEQKIVQEIESEWSWRGGALVNELRAFADRLIGLSIDTEFQRLQLKGRDTLAKLRSAHHVAEADLGPLRVQYRDARSEYLNFRSTYDLNRPARNPAGRWTTFGLLFVLVALESILNGFFFAKGSDFGLVGGVGTAIGISIVNVAGAFLLGLGPARWLHHRNILLKLLGFILLVVGISAFFGLHLFAAHLRDATVVVGEEHAMSQAIESMMRTPWVLADLSSMYLVCLGILFGLGSLWKGYAFDDPYPGYGAQWRRLEHARVMYSDEHALLFDELKEIKDKTVEDLDGGITRIPLFPQQAAALRAQRAALLQTFKNFEIAAESAANRLLAQYRDANRKRRATSPPAYFDQLWRLPHSILGAPDVQTLTAEPIQPPTDVPQALQELRLLTKDVLSEYEDLITKYPHTSMIQ